MVGIVKQKHGNKEVKQQPFPDKRLIDDYKGYALSNTNWAYLERVYVDKQKVYGYFEAFFIEFVAKSRLYLYTLPSVVKAPAKLESIYLYPVHGFLRGLEKANKTLLQFSESGRGGLHTYLSPLFNELQLRTEHDQQIHSLVSKQVVVLTKIVNKLPCFSLKPDGYVGFYTSPDHFSRSVYRDLLEKAFPHRIINI